jgi:hypothetical protein
MRLIILILFLLFFTKTTFSEDQYLVSYTLVKSHTKKSISELWKKHKIPKVILPVKNDVDIYEVIIYNAKWIDSTYG